MVKNIMITKEAYEEQLAKAKEFHGEVCGGIAIGTKLAMYGMDLMGLELNKRHKNLVVFLEIDRCMADAVQSVTKCSMGKRSLKQMYYGKFGVTFYNMDTKKAIRVSDADANSKKDFCETKEEMIERFKTTPAEELFNVEKVKIRPIPEAQMPGAKHTSTFCSVCNEKITDDRQLIRGGRPICKSCAEESYYEVIE